VFVADSAPFLLTAEYSESRGSRWINATWITFWMHYRAYLLYRFPVKQSYRHAGNSDKFSWMWARRGRAHSIHRCLVWNRKGKLGGVGDHAPLHQENQVRW